MTAPATPEGPIPASAASGPFHGLATEPIPGPGLPPRPLADAGYIEQEYVISGEFDGQPYRTSLLVRMPGDPATFSGVVVVETLHAAGAVPMSAYHIALKAEGHGYALAESQKVALDVHVKPSDPARYADLEIPDATGEVADDADAGESMAGQRAAIERQAPMSNAILSQVGALLKSNQATGPFAGMTVNYLVMGGCSQTGATTLRYIRDAHFGARMADGSAIYDGYFPALAGGTEPVPPLGVPVIHALGEGDMMGGRPLGYRRANSDDPGDLFRLYEIVGASHVPTRGVESSGDIFPTLANASGADDELSQLPSAMLYFAAFHNLIEWITTGRPAPAAAPIDVDDLGQLVRDEHGNARGGVRLSYIDVPFATYVARSPGGDMFRGMIGQQRVFSKEKLRSLYPTHDDYVAKARACLEALVQERWLFPSDARELMSEAEGAVTP